MHGDEGKKRGSWSGKTPSKNYARMMEAFRENTRLLRERMGFTTRQFAAKAGFSQSWLYYIEATEKAVSFELMVHVADTFGVPLATMLVPGAFDNPNSRKAS